MHVLRALRDVFWVRRQSTWHYFLLAALAILLGVSSQLRSPTVDEPYHLARGLAYWQTASPRYSVDHPILLNLISAIPAALTSEIQLENLAGWGKKTVHGIAFGYYEADFPAFAEQVFAGRLLIGAVAVLFAGYLYRFAVENWGWRAGILCLSLLAFNPPFLAHGRLLMTDLGAAFGIFAVTAEWLRLRRSNSPRPPVRLALAVGLGAMAKYSVLPVIALLALLLPVSSAWRSGRYSEDAPSQRLTRACLDVAIVAVLALLLLNAAYCFEGSGQSIATLYGKSSEATLPRLLEPVAWMRIPLPEPYVKGLVTVFNHNERGHAGYFFGQFNPHGHPLFFPTMIALKAPIAMLVTTVCGILLVARKRLEFGLTGVIMSSVVAFMLVGMLNASINIGIRHALPLVVFIVVFAGVSADRALAACESTQRGRGARVRWLLLAALATAPLEAVVNFPDYLGYIQPLVGRELAHSQITTKGEDSGQSAIDLARFLRGRQVTDLHLVRGVRHEKLELERLGVRAEETRCPKRVHGWVALHRKHRIDPDCAIPSDEAPVGRIYDQIDVYYRDP